MGRLRASLRDVKRRMLAARGSAVDLAAPTSPEAGWRHRPSNGESPIRQRQRQRRADQLGSSCPFM